MTYAAERWLCQHLWSRMFYNFLMCFSDLNVSHLTPNGSCCVILKGSSRLERKQTFALFKTNILTETDNVSLYFYINSGWNNIQTHWEYHPNLQFPLGYAELFSIFHCFWFSSRQLLCFGSCFHQKWAKSRVKIVTNTTPNECWCCSECAGCVNKQQFANTFCISTV